MIARTASLLSSLQQAGRTTADRAAAYAVQTPDTPSAEALTARVRAAFPAVELRIQRIFETTEGDLATHFKLIFDGVGFDDLGARAFEVAYDLLDVCNLVAAEPLLPSPEGQIDMSMVEPTVSSDGSSGGTGSGPADRMWQLEHMAVREAWHESTALGRDAKGKGILIGQVDTGVADHLMVRGQLATGWNFVDLPESADATDPLGYIGFPGHGLAVAAAAAGADVPSLKMCGVAPLAKVMPMRAVNTVVIVPDNSEYVARGVEKAWKNGCHVISMSLGGAYPRALPPKRLAAAIETAVNGGVIVIAAAGNWIFSEQVTYPGWDPNCICVAASTMDRKPFERSCRGTEVAISTPGHQIWTAWRAKQADSVENLGVSSGTSYGAAHVAGVAALWLAHHSPKKIYDTYGHTSKVSAAFRKMIRQTAFRPPVWDDKQYGAGIVHAFGLLLAALPAVGALAEEVAVPSPAMRLVEALRSEGIDAASTSRVDDAFALRYGPEIDWLLARRMMARQSPRASTVVQPQVSASLAQALPAVAALGQPEIETLSR